MEIGCLVYLGICAVIFCALGKPVHVRPLSWRMTLASLSARAFLAVVAIPLTILLSIEWLLGVRVLKVRRDP